MTAQTQVQMERPEQTQFLEEMPKAPATVLAGSLLAPAERESAEKTGARFCIQFEGKTHMVPAHMQVPAGATAVRTSSGSLLGIPAVTGG